MNGYKVNYKDTFRGRHTAEGEKLGILMWLCYLISFNSGFCSPRISVLFVLFVLPFDSSALVVESSPPILTFIYKRATMAHRRTSSRLTPSLSSKYQMSPMSASISLPMAASSFLTPRKPRHRRTTYLALFALIAVSMYIFFFARPTLALAPRALGGGNKRVTAPHTTNDSDNLPQSRVFRFPPSQHRKFKLAASDKPQVQLTEAQELAAVSSFLASLPQNVIPSSVDPTHPIDPQLVLDFDTRSSRAADDVKEIVDEMWVRNPVVLYSKVCLLNLIYIFKAKC